MEISKRILGDAIIFAIPKGTLQKLLCGFFSVRGVPSPPTPLTENHFAKKNLTELGGTQKNAVR